MEIKMIVVTGGPCAGKTSAMEWIRRDIEKMGYRVLVVPETATELIGGGVSPWTCGTNFEYQTIQMHLQKEKENCFRKAASTMGEQAEKILIVCDRGMYDNMVYMTKKEFYQILSNLSLTDEEALNTYGAVFHLVTSAIGTDSFSTNLNNTARYEDEETSRWMDKKFEIAWAMHEKHYRVNSYQDFEKKMMVLINGIADFLNEGIPYEQAPLPNLIPQRPHDESPWENEVVFPT